MGDVLHHISKWGKLIFAVIAVYAVIHRNETDIVFREEGVCVVPNTEIISAKPGHILDDDHCHIAHFDILNHFLKRRTVEIRAGITVVHIETGIPETIFFGVFLQ